MSERAKKAAAVLYERGWSVGESEGKSCARCGHDTVKGGRYCYNCGEPLHPEHGDDTLRDLEAAIAAAVDGAA